MNVNTTLKKKNNYRNAIYWTLILLAGLSLVFVFGLNYADSDLYYMIPTGRYIINNGIPWTNPFVTTAGQKIITQNWLYCVIVAFIYNNLHSLGLYLFSVIMQLGMIATVIWFFKVKKADNKWRVVVALIIFYLCFNYINIRPQMLTCILCFLEVIGIEKFKETNRKAWLLFIPLSMLLESNCHASYIVMHLIIVLPYIMPAFKFMRLNDACLHKKQLFSLIAASLISIGFAFINPYHYHAVIYLINSLKSKVFHLYSISEMQPISILSVQAIFYMVFLIIFFAAWRRKKLTSVDFYMYLGMSVLFLLALKWTPFYAFGLMYLFRNTGIFSVDSISEAKKAYLEAGKSYLKAGVILVIFLISVVYGSAFVSSSQYVFDATTDSHLNYHNEEMTEYTKLTDYLDKNDSDAAVYATFVAGNYFEYRGYKVYSDARPELYTQGISGSDDISYVVLAISYDDIDYRESTEGHVCSYSEYSKIVDDLDVDYIVCPISQTTLLHYLQSNPDKYELAVDEEMVQMYKKIV